MSYSINTDSCNVIVLGVCHNKQIYISRRLAPTTSLLLQLLNGPNFPPLILRRSSCFTLLLPSTLLFRHHCMLSKDLLWIDKLIVLEI